MRHAPRPDEVPDPWTDEVVELRDVAALDHHPGLDDSCLRLLREIAYRSQNEAGCCWQGRARFLDRFGWSGEKLDHHRTHLTGEPLRLLEEVKRSGRTTLRRLDPARIRALVAEIDTTKDSGVGTGHTTKESRVGPTKDSGVGPTKESRVGPTKDSRVEGVEVGGRGSGEGRAASGRHPPGNNAGSGGDSPDGGSAPGDDGAAPAADAGATNAPGDGRSARQNGKRPPKWHRTIGEHPETGREVRVGRNEHGPYVAHICPHDHSKSRWENLPEKTTDATLEAMTLEEALELLDLPSGEAAKQRGRFGPEDPEQRAAHARQIEDSIPVLRG